ncbi:helix-turn-helix domain-containing protein [Actibacterium sp. XHP0104]|uniref:helix-turn-helix domain-containing protein n=1 Tax=Actibacterium sp. XHP0104 TaxID=2984335 RepID=UPI0021E8394C|nr:helix-turn-helix domain-containing protein [Actibacterium sp. XHP0104]MCV2881276.1 helix-turn-helix domain-containing protein [Actibacterium sp. XHP0104]
MPQEIDQSDGWYSDEQATFGDRLAAARQAMGLGQGDLAARLGVRLKTLRGWEEDLSEPRANKLQILAGVLNVSIMWLLTGQGDGLDAPDQAGQIPAEAAALLSELREAQAGLQALAGRIDMLERRLRAAITEEGTR